MLTWDWNPDPTVGRVRLGIPLTESQSLTFHIHVNVRISLGARFFFSPWKSWSKTHYRAGPAPWTSHSSIERFKKYAPKGMTSLWVQLSPSRMELPLLRPRNLIAKWGSSIQGEDLGDGWVTGRSELGKWGILGYCKWLIQAHSSSFQLPFYSRCMDCRQLRPIFSWWAVMSS